MTNLELVLNMPAEATTTEISKEKKRGTFETKPSQSKAALLQVIPAKRLKPKRVKKL